MGWHWHWQLHDFCTTVANMGKIVVVAALDGTFAAQVRLARSGGLASCVRVA